MSNVLRCGAGCNYWFGRRLASDRSATTPTRYRWFSLPTASPPVRRYTANSYAPSDSIVLTAMSISISKAASNSASAVPSAAGTTRARAALPAPSGASKACIYSV